MYNITMKKLFTKILSAIIVTVVALSFTACKMLPLGDDYTAHDLVNGVYNEKIITANIAVNLSVYDKTFYGERVNESISHGSGIIFKKQSLSEGYIYYALTNNHVIYRDDVGRYFEYTINDCYGEHFIAKVEFSSADYDLAVISFSSYKEYNVLSFANSNPHVGDMIISFGSPLGIDNAVTFGTVKSYEQITLAEGFSKEMSNVTFAVIEHDAYMDSGSSGGVLLDKNYRICGINYAAKVDKDKKFVTGFAIPIDRIVEFINMQK